MTAEQPRVALRSERVAVGTDVRPATVVIDDGRITAVLAPGESPADGTRVTDLGADLLVPGLIDCHTHLFMDGAANRCPTNGS